jgi:formylglycine-generating enzyme required for sulfatase activity
VAVPRVAASGENYAFLVAVGDYDVKQLKPLRYTRSDIQEFAKTLAGSGFKSDHIVVLHDDLKTLPQRRYFPEAEKIRNEFDLLLSGVDEGDALIVAFSGHGVQFDGDERNFFCPADADLEDPKRQRLISLQEIYDKLKGCPADRKLLLVDACRNDPLSQLGKSRQTVKLKSVTRPQTEPVPKGIVALFSCSAGQESFEWPDLGHGVFFHHVLTGWQGAADDGDQKLSLDELVAYARKNTQTFARLKLGAAQTPQSKGEFNGTWVLRELRSVAAKSLTNSIGMKFTLIPAGEFEMGSNDGADDEKPVHRVRISQPFYLGVYEVTQAQYERVMGKNPSWFSKSGIAMDKVAGLNTSDWPVEGVSWNDAQEFCRKLSTLGGESGRRYRLPTEAEWEYACRAGTKTKFHFGDVLNGDKANVDGNYPQGTTTKGPYLERTTSVGRYGPNAFGLYDMHGNVHEWCEDVYDEKAYAKRGTLTTDPLVTSRSESRVLRGGSWFNLPRYARSASRNRNTPDNWYNLIGFRVVCE